MPGLVDIAPLVETVDVRGAKVDVKGVSAEAVASLLWRFPELRKQWATGNWDAAELMVAGAQAVQVGTASFADPRACPRVRDELADWAANRGVARLEHLNRVV